MKIGKQAQNIAKTIFRSVRKLEGIQETKLRRFITLLKRDRSSKAMEILAVLEKLLVNEKKEKQLFLESSNKLTNADKDEIKSYFEKLSDRKLDLVELENKDLISGLKIKLADNVWENSVISNLQKMKETTQ